MAQQVIDRDDITAEVRHATPRIRDIMERKCYVSKGNTLDDVDFADPGILADIRAAFAVLAQIEVED